MNWHRLAAIGLSLCACAALCYPGQLVNELPREYVERLNTLKLALALNNGWSAVWSETLKREAVAKPPDARLCAQLVPDDKPEDEVANEPEPTDTYNPFEVVVAVVDTCWYSGTFVRYGVRVLGHAVNCLFSRHALLHIAAVDETLRSDAGNTELNGFLRRLVDDYRAVAAKLAAVGTPLHHLLLAATFFDDVDKLTTRLPSMRPKMARDVKADMKNVSGQLREELKSYRDTYCAVTEDRWYDADTDKTVKLTLDDSESGPSDGDHQPQGAGSLLERADRLRLLMRRVFDGLRATGMSQTVWTEIFRSNIFVKASDLMSTGHAANVKSDDSQGGIVKVERIN
uniref:Uncharacterized protein n=1 Tax=Sipha flava TaxID=143950 RepID=A0A2S2RAB4_9HEMI